MNNLIKDICKIPFDGVIFDCDSTLSTIEGIDELAALANVKEEVARLTDMAMDGDIPLESVYENRLQLIQPSKRAVEEIAQIYLATIVEGAAQTIATLQQHQIKVAIVSGGLFDAIVPMARQLGVKQDDVFAVHLAFDEMDNYSHILPTPLTTAKGKFSITNQWKTQHQLQRVALIGDGMSDVAALGAADVVIGYGGVVCRQAVKKSATYFYEQRDLRGLLELLLPLPTNT